MNQHTPQEETKRIIINDMMRIKNVLVKPNADMLACKLRREKRRMKSNSIDEPILRNEVLQCHKLLPQNHNSIKHFTLKPKAI